MNFMTNPFALLPNFNVSLLFYCLPQLNNTDRSFLFVYANFQTILLENYKESDHLLSCILAKTQKKKL